MRTYLVAGPAFRVDISLAMVVLHDESRPFVVINVSNMGRSAGVIRRATLLEVSGYQHVQARSRTDGATLPVELTPTKATFWAIPMASVRDAIGSEKPGAGMRAEVMRGTRRKRTRAVWIGAHGSTRPPNRLGKVRERISFFRQYRTPLRFLPGDVLRDLIGR